MWPKLLDLTQDECRGALRRLELETYSNVVGAFRAQGILNAAKLRMLKDLREAFHISDARHKAEVRRVVNDESLSTIAKMTYGPNTEIEWNKEGSRGFLIINRKPSQTALSVVANKATELGDSLNKQLKPPSDVFRTRTLDMDNDANASDKIVTYDPHDPNITKPKAETPKAEKLNNEKPILVPSVNFELKKKDSTKHVTIVEPPTSKPSLTTVGDINPSTKSMKAEESQMTTPTAPMPKPITSNSRRRKSTTALVNYNTPAKAILISNRRDTMIETSPKIREHHPPEPTPPPKIVANEVRVISKKVNEIRDEMTTNVTTTVCPPPQPQLQLQPKSQSQSNLMPQKLSTEPDMQIIEAIVPHKEIMGTIKGTRNVMNAISQGAQLVKVIDSKIIKKPLPNMYVTKPSANQPIKTAAIKQTFTPIKTSNIEYLSVNDGARMSKQFKGHKIQQVQVIPSNPSTIMNNINLPQKVNRENDIISIPTARNPNIVKTSDKTIMHISPHLPQKHQIKTTILGNAAQNHTKYQQKHVVQVMQPQTQHRMVTIHPNTTVLKVPMHASSINEAPQEYVYEEQINDWQNFDPRHIDNQNGYVKIVNRTRNASTHNDRDYQNHEAQIITENIIYDDDIITEEYITTEDFSADNVIEMETDATTYATNDVTFVSNNVIGS